MTTSHSTDQVSRVFRDARIVANFSLFDWDNLIRQARHAALLARLHALLAKHGQMESAPPGVRWHFEAAVTLATRQQIAVRWEIRKIAEALADLDIPFVVLKGGAYVIADLPAACGRTFHDLDILVPRNLLAAVENALMLAGWHPGRLSDYDQRYYRRWMHEIPPLQHIQRGTIIDVHHAILPETARYHPDSAKLRSKAIPIHNYKNVQVLAPEDMLLHSATHLFHDGTLPHGLRDLTDLDLLFRHFSALPGFWPRLQNRARELQLSRPLFYAVRYAQYFLAMPAPHDFVHELAIAAPSPVVLAGMDAIFKRVLAPDHAKCSDAWTPLARKAAYIRAHWLRMPPHLLFPHLVYKALIHPHYATQAM